ncbi:MAG: lmo0937 family membrane protein [Ignavibacteria bacterium]|nr:lmo0937 family membrane protein [Ignavibacteria bacterium]
MGSLLYVVAVVLVIAWILGLTAFNAGGLIHILLVIAAVVVLLRIIQGRRVL